MESVKDVVKNVLNSFFDVGDQDKTVCISFEDTELIATAVEDSLKSKGVIE